MDRDAEFRAFVDAHGATLLHAARLLTGDHHRGEDLLQTVLIRLYARWGRADAPLAYARKALATAHIDTTRRRWWGERPSAELPDLPGPGGSGGSGGSGGGDPTDDRDELRRLLATLSPRDRTVVVLRYYCDLSEADTARTLGIPPGTVKSSCSRALAHLRVDAARAAEGTIP